MKKTFLASLLSLTIFFAMGASLAHALPDVGANPGVDEGENSGPSLNFKIDNPFNDKVGNNLFSLMKAIINDIIMPVGGVLCVLAFIYAGFKYVMAGGGKGIEEANQALLYASIGTAVLLGSWVLANVVCRTINLLGGPICPT